MTKTEKHQAIYFIQLNIDPAGDCDIKPFVVFHVTLNYKSGKLIHVLLYIFNKFTHKHIYTYVYIYWLIRYS